MRFYPRWVVAGICCLALTMSALGATRIQDNLHLIELSNGMKIFVYPRHTAPLFTGMIFVDAGSAQEQVAQTGVAHLLEHMAFKGTPWIGTSNWEKEKEILEHIEAVGSELTLESDKRNPDQQKIQNLQERLATLQREEAQYIVPNEYDQLITREGGQEINATTDNDYTNYFVTLPSNKLELWAMMESQRLIYPVWREFYLERSVVAEERRMRTEDSPGGKLFEEFVAAAYKAHPYGVPVIGWMSDINNLTITKLDHFYKKWYVPQNMVAVVVGDVKLEDVRAVAEKYFGSIPARTSPVDQTTVEPAQRGERRVKVEFEAQPQLVMGWHKPTFPDRDAYVFEVIQYLLTRTGRSSRLYERLVKKDALCQEVESFTAPGEKYPNLFTLWLVPQNPHTSAEVEKATLDEIERIKHEPVSEAELAKLRNQIDATFLKELETNLGLARQFGTYYIATKDPAILDKLRDQMKTVTPQDIMRVAQKYLTPENRTVAELVTKRQRPMVPPTDRTPAAPTQPNGDEATSATTDAKR